MTFIKRIVTAFLIGGLYFLCASHKVTFSSKNSSIVPGLSPIRIYLSFANASNEDLVNERLKETTLKAIRKISRVLSVYPLELPLLLKRTMACNSRWTSGPNIPDDHLEGLTVFDSSTSTPQNGSISGGRGIDNADFIFYVQSSHTKFCNRENVFAYATWCQLGEHDRPIAGYANFCPLHFLDEHYSNAVAANVAMHELIHVLGFSVTLFPKYKDCQSSHGKLICYLRKNKLIQNEDGMLSLNLPLPSKALKGVLNCTKNCLELEEQDVDLISESSHWKNLPHSIMSRTLGKNISTYLDEITLAVLQDSGWYKVNFDAALSFGDLSKKQSQISNSCAGSDEPCIGMLTFLLCYLTVLVANVIYI